MEAGQTYDVIVVGAGAGGMTAAVVAAAEKLRVLLLEKSPLFGGTTAISGGMVWIPANAAMRAAGLPDTRENAERYLRCVLPPQLRGPLLEAFLTRADEAVGYLERHSSVRLRIVKTYPDYYQDAPGASLGGRVLEPAPFDARALGARFAQLRPPLREFTLFGGMMVDRADIPHFRRVGSSLSSTVRVGGLIAHYLWQRRRFDRGATLYLGNALAGRLLHSIIQRKVEVRLQAHVKELLTEGGRVAGVSAEVRGEPVAFRAVKGVILATGGFSHDPVRRGAFLPAAAREFSAACPSDAGDGIAMASALGASFREGADQNAFWTPVSAFHRRDGETALFPHTVTDRGKPGFIAVDRSGGRFVNEACSYHEFAKAMLRLARPPVYLICDRPALRRYGLGGIRPFAFQRAIARHVASGDLFVGATVRDLAGALGVPPAALKTTISDYNDGARAGVDRQFGRGSDAYQRHMGDADRQPNPCVAPLEHGPYYAVALHPADLATAAGLATNEVGQALRADGSPIAGLYACGADMSSVMEGAYPGPGVTLGPALTFGYLAARAIAGASTRET